VEGRLDQSALLAVILMPARPQTVAYHLSHLVEGGASFVEGAVGDQDLMG
jgi:hypothetical protein